MVEKTMGIIVVAPCDSSNTRRRGREDNVNVETDQFVNQDREPFELPSLYRYSKPIFFPQPNLKPGARAELLRPHSLGRKRDEFQASRSYAP